MYVKQVKRGLGTEHKHTCHKMQLPRLVSAELVSAHLSNEANYATLGLKLMDCLPTIR